MRSRETGGELRLINARDGSAVMDEISRNGLDIDHGMVLNVDDVLYYGSDAICALSLVSSESGIFSRLNYWVFRSRPRTPLLYPILRACRNVALKIMRNSKINKLELAGNEKFYRRWAGVGLDSRANGC